MIKKLILVLLLINCCAAMDYAPETTFRGDINFDSGYYAINATEGIINIKDYGAVAENMSYDNRNIIQACIDLMEFGDILVIPGGNFSYMSTIEFDPPSGCGLLCIGELKYCNTTGNPAFVIGNSASFRSKYRIDDLSISSYPSANWTDGRVGVKAMNLYNCRIGIGRVYGFSENLYVLGNSFGCGYNNFYLNYITDGKVGIHLGAENSGWTNNNKFHGGRISLTGGFGDYSGTALIRVDHGTTYGLNDNIFYGPSFESSNSEIAADINASYTYLERIRMDGGPGNISLGTGSSYCRITSSYGLFPEINTDDSGVRNTLVGRDRIIISGGASSGYPLLRLYSPSSGANMVEVCDATRTTQKWSVDTLGRMSISNNDAASTVGTVTGKFPIYDVEKNVIGYIPIYDSIT